MRKQSGDESTIEKLANAAILIVVSRVSAPLMLIFVGWLVYTVDHMQIDVATLTSTITGKVETLTAKIEGIDKRTDKLENRWDSLIGEALAGENKQSKGGI